MTLRLDFGSDVFHRGTVGIDHREAIGNDASPKTSVWKRVTNGVLVHETPCELG